MKKYKAPKGNLKISNFFNKSPPKEILNNKNNVLNQLKDNIPSTSKESTSKRKLENNDLSSPCKKKLCENITPKKNHTPNSRNSPKSSQKLSTKKSPYRAKLFEKSPKEISSFKVEIINNFVKISPSKFDLNVPGTSIPYLSPSKSEISKKAQIYNEETPKKTLSPTRRSATPKSRMMLSFDLEEKSELTVEKIQETDKTELHTEENSFHLLDDDFSLLMMNVDYDLDLKTPQHCKILEIRSEPSHIVLTLESTKTKSKAICKMEGFWAGLNLNVGDTVYINAFKGPDNEWLINNNDGLLVFEPDHLISCTTIMSSFFCKRKTVLSEKFLDFDNSNKQMIIGNIVHHLLQITMKNKMTKEEEIYKVIERLMKSSSIIKKLYVADLRLNDIEDDVKQFVPKVIEFLKCYVNKNDRYYVHGNWTGKIDCITDIEENIWCPELGVKGKIDVTVKNGLQTMPLELKTGRATVSLEHRGQVILYLMMMAKIGYTVTSGLLLYLREGVLKEIPMSSKEKRDLIILRNELAYYLTRKVNSKNLRKMELPEPLNNERICGRCPYNAVCTSLLKYENYDLTKNKSIKNVQEKALNHLSEDHLQYFLHWSNLIFLEGSEINEKQQKDIYTLPPEQREIKGKTIINVKVMNCNETISGLYEHKFEKIGETTNFLTSGIMEYNYITVSTSTRPAVAAGLVYYIDSTTLIANLDRDLLKKFPQNIFHIDTYDSTITETFNLTCLSLLLEDTARAKRLRELIIEKQPPKFLSKLPKVVAVKGTPILKALNRSQQHAVLRALAVEDFLLIKGMPGSGKTQTIVALIQLLLELDKTVLITSHTNSAVDNVCIKLQKVGIEVLRLGTESRVNKEMKTRSEHYLTKDCKSPEELEKVYNEAKVVAVTCFASGHPLLSKRVMDYCVVDESTQIIQTAAFKTLYCSKRFILIGDPDQLPPLIKNQDAITSGMSETLFERLACPEATITLNINYRMNNTITALANALTYQGELLVANDKIAKATLKINYENLNEDKWILKILNTKLEAAVQFIDTGPVWKLPKTKPIWYSQKHHEYGVINIYEVAIVKRIIDALIKGGVNANNIGVIATYTTQVTQISLLLNNPNIDVSTVDQYQGKDKNVIIYSCCVSREYKDSNKLSFELLESKKRLNVAITRAKHKLILIGDKTTLINYSTFKIILGTIDNKYIMDINKEIKEMSDLLTF